ncbi:immune inhibitor A domain-containing protein [Pedococcus soli]
MTHRRITGRALRAAAVVPTFALVATSLAAVGAAGTSSAAPAPAPASPSAAAGGSTYLNTVAPRAEQAFGTDTRVTKDKKVLARQAAVLEKAKKYDAKHAKGNPVAARGLAKIEAQSLRTGQSPAAIKSKFKQAPAMQEAKLLTILVEFNDKANDDFRTSMVPSEFGSDTCKLGSVQNGPKHNTIPNPASAPLLDNNSMWVKDFSSAHYNTMLYTKTGITQRVRTDLKGPDGKPGFDISGYTMKNMYEEMSKGAYTVDGAATPWITVPHSEAYYGATRCHQDENGVWTYDAIQDMQGHPSNPLGAGQLPIDAVAALAKAQPNFPWADYDLEDQGDVDGDGNFNEPDGVIDHVVLVHAGSDKSGGGGAQGTYAIWAHSSAVAGGAPVPGTNLKLSNYIVQPEDSGVGVFAHEYGHDLGLPDLYDTASGGDSDVDFWDLMSSGSHSGPIFQSMPTHMGIWDKYVLGWADPKVINPGDPRQSVLVGQSSRTPRGTQDGLKVNLPNKTITLATPHSGAKMWFSSSDQSWADNTLTRTVSVPVGSTDAKFWMWNNYSIEEDWDFGFVEVSTDGGATWTEQKVYDTTGAEVSTSDTYADPNGNLKTFGNKKYGLTGATDGWEHHYAKVTPYAGKTIQVRLHYATDAAFEDRGWFVDDLSLTNGASTVWSDNAEANNGWTAKVGTHVDTTGAGWILDTGTQTKAQYYLVEWRNFDGFDKGLQYGYDTTYQAKGAWNVEKIKYNAPGALIWYRDTTYGNANHVLNNLSDLPSEGTKGGLLIVDSHFDPLRRTGAAAALDPTLLKNLPSRPQSSNAAFGLVGTYPFKECVTNDAVTKTACNTYPKQVAVRTFTDNKGWYPGIEYRPDLDAKNPYFYRDADASVVVPSKGNSPYTVKIVDKNGKLLPAQYGDGLGTGNPADSKVGYGTTITVAMTMQNNQMARLMVTPPKK